MQRSWTDRKGPIGTALAEAVRPPGAPGRARLRRVARSDAAGLVEAAVRHGVAGYLQLAMARDPVALSALAREGLSDVCQAQFARHVRLSAELVQVGHLLNERDIPWVSFKGPVLAETAHLRPDLRAYVDLDLLVDGEDLPLALTTLEDAGCRLLERNWPRMIHLLPGQVHLLTPAQTLLDLHWHVLDDPALRRDARMDSSTLISRSRPVALPTGPVPTFDPADTVVHLCVHAAQSGGNRLIWLVDIDRALALTGLSEVVDRALEMRVGPAVEVMLRRARAVLGTPVATGQLRRLVPEPLWRAVSSMSVVLPPVNRARGEGSVSRLVARATRSGSTSSEREAIRRLGGWLRHGMTMAEHDSRGLWDARNPESMFYENGDADGRGRFLRAVRVEAQGDSASRARSSAAPSSGSE